MVAAVIISTVAYRGASLQWGAGNSDMRLCAYGRYAVTRQTWAKENHNCKSSLRAIWGEKGRRHFRYLMLRD